MAIESPPIQEKTADSLGLFPQPWVFWFFNIYDETKKLEDDIAALELRITALEALHP